MRRIVVEGKALGLFVEGTRQRSGVPGPVQPGAAMVALQEEVPLVPVAIHGSQWWKPGSLQPVSLAWGEPMALDGLPKAGKGYKQASSLLQAEIRRLWEWLVVVHELGRPAGVPPAAGRLMEP
jgi:1-acyl-sn-glycerol-3-phosphate acyltransferase